jgi:REP element-mobilizing transposase RayT
MKFNPEKHNRKSTRLKNNDYSSSGAYFVTICTFQRECIFGEIINGEMIFSSAGERTLEVWEGLPSRFPTVELDVFVIMPNHVHGVICLTGEGSEAVSISTVLRTFKSLSARVINQELGRAERPAWQKRFWDRIVRDEAELERTRAYIVNNPQSWAEDIENPNNTTM